TKEERLEFVRKVYFTLTLMLLADVGIICCALFIPGARAFFQRHLIIYICSYIFFFIIYISLVCCRVVRHTFPYNYIMVALLAISMGFMLACIASFHSIDELLIAAAGTMLVTLAVTLIALCGTFDITGYGFYLVIASLVLM
ncbi:Protein lifeguard 2, partial [Gryllus bimaculatus]